MTASARIQVTGAQDAVKALRKIDPELRKQFNADVKRITAPIVDDAKSKYPKTMLSGMERAWSQRGNKKFPYDPKRAQRGVKSKIDTSRKAASLIRVQQTDPAAAIIEVAGKGKSNPLGTALNRFGQPSRFLWPAAERNLGKVESEMKSSVLDVIRTVEREL